jgi:hypothetical protein
LAFDRNFLARDSNSYVFALIVELDTNCRIYLIIIRRITANMPPHGCLSIPCSICGAPLPIRRDQIEGSRIITEEEIVMEFYASARRKSGDPTGGVTVTVTNAELNIV